MTSRSRRRDRFATLLIWVALALAVGACRDGGYPKDDLDLGKSTSAASAVDVVRSLNRMNASSLTATRWKITLIGPCELRLFAQRPDGSKQVVKLELLHSDVQVKGNVGGPVHAVQVDFSGTPELSGEHLFEADRWTDAVEYATKLQALQRICARQR